MTSRRDRMPVERPGQQVSSRPEVDAFLDRLRAVPPRAGAARRGRLVFALDATASRKPTWDRACHIQAEMFHETAALGRSEEHTSELQSLTRISYAVFCLQKKNKHTINT